MKKQMIIILTLLLCSCCIHQEQADAASKPAKAVVKSVANTKTGTIKVIWKKQSKVNHQDHFWQEDDN